MIDIDMIIFNYNEEAKIDFVGLWQIAGSIEYNFEIKIQHKIRSYALQVARGLMERGVYPGDYDYADQIYFWPGTIDEHETRIREEWIQMGKTPTLSEPICWFGRQSP